MKYIFNNYMSRIILAIDEKANYSSKINRKLKGNITHVNLTFKRLEEQKLITKKFNLEKNKHIKYIKLTPKGEQVKELLIKLKEVIE